MQLQIAHSFIALMFQLTIVFSYNKFLLPVLVVFVAAVMSPLIVHNSQFKWHCHFQYVHVLENLSFLSDLKWNRMVIKINFNWK